MEDRASLKAAKRAGTLKSIARLRKSGESMASRVKTERLAALEAQAFKWIARGRPANLELGRVFLQLKAIIGHGQWQCYYRESFGSSGIALRTAEDYMRLARSEGAILQNADSAVFPPATDQSAQETRTATKQAETEINRRLPRKPKKTDIPVEGTVLYRIPVHLNGDEMEACNALQKLPEWPRAEEKIVALLKQLCIEFGATKSNALQGIVNEDAIS